MSEKEPELKPSIWTCSQREARLQSTPRNSADAPSECCGGGMAAILVFGCSRYWGSSMLHCTSKSTLSFSITVSIDPTVLLARQFHFHYSNYNNNNNNYYNYNYNNLFLLPLPYVNLSQFNSLCLGLCRFSGTSYWSNLVSWIIVIMFSFSFFSVQKGKARPFCNLLSNTLLNYE